MSALMKAVKFLKPVEVPEPTPEQKARWFAALLRGVRELNSQSDLLAIITAAHERADQLNATAPRAGR